ncbi:MAG: cellulose biosynthesis cyclic di-GMP-binding regulatory protein BcsB [Gemmatimonadaceae bacterium]
MHRKARAGIALFAFMAGSAHDVSSQRRTTRAFAAAAVTPPTAVAEPIAGRSQHVRTLEQLGLPQGVGLDGTRDQANVTFRLPALAPVTNGVLSLKLHFSAALIAQSNVQVYANGLRLAAISRADADTRGDVTVDLPVPSASLSNGFLAVSLRSSLATTPDRCLDDRLGYPHVQVDPASKFSYTLPLDAVNTVETALGVLPDTVTLSIPARKLNPSEFWSAFTAATELGRQGHTVRYAQLPAAGDVEVGTAAEIAATAGIATPPAAGSNVAVFRYGTGDAERVGIALTSDSSGAGAAIIGQAWSPLANAPSLVVRQARGDARLISNDPTFADLRIPDLQQNLNAEATWKIGVDIRDLPAGRLPSHVDLRVATAPNTNKRQLTLFVFWNGTLVRSADIAGDGLPQLVGADIPSDLIGTRNEIRVIMQRHLEATEGCGQADASLPAQILPSSRIVTAAVSPSADVFDGVAARLGSASSLYLPNDALDHADRYLPTLVGIGRAFWLASRSPRPVFYGTAAPALPTGAFVLIGQPSGVTIDAPLNMRSGRLTIHSKETRDTLLDVADVSNWSIAQVVSWNGQTGVQLLPATGAGAMPANPEAYGHANLLLARGDSALFPLNTNGSSGSLIVNDGPTLMQRLRRDWILWAIFGVLLIGVPLALGIRAVTRRTPRRQVRRSSVSTPRVGG